MCNLKILRLGFDAGEEEGLGEREGMTDPEAFVHSLSLEVVDLQGIPKVSLVRGRARGTWNVGSPHCLAYHPNAAHFPWPELKATESVRVCVCRGCCAGEGWDTIIPQDLEVTSPIEKQKWKN